MTNAGLHDADGERGEPSTRGARGLATRERILRAASRLFAEKGYAATSTREIAEAVGIMQPSLFHHFESKAAIASELFSHNLAEPADVAQSLAEEEGSPAERFLRYLVFDVSHILRCPYNLAGLDPDIALAGPRFRHWREVQQSIRDARRLMIRQGIEAGEFIDIDPELAHHAVTGLILGVIKGFTAHPTENVEGMAESVAKLVLRGLLRDPHAAEAILERSRDAARLRLVSGSPPTESTGG